MNEYNYKIRSIWSNRPESPAAVGERFLRTLDRLSSIDPIFGDWNIIDGRAERSLPIKRARAGMAAIVENNVVVDDFGDPYPEDGYWALGVNCSRINPRRMGFSVKAGGKYDGQAELEAGYIDMPPDLAIVTYPIFNGALLTMVSIWDLPWAYAYAFKLDYQKAPTAPGVPPIPYTLFHMPWLAYLSAPLAAGLDVPPDIPTERTPDGGLLMIAAEDRLDPADPGHMARAHVLVRIMTERTGRG